MLLQLWTDGLTEDMWRQLLLLALAAQHPAAVVLVWKQAVVSLWDTPLLILMLLSLLVAMQGRLRPVREGSDSACACTPGNRTSEASRSSQAVEDRCFECPGQQAGSKHGRCHNSSIMSDSWSS